MISHQSRSGMAMGSTRIRMLLSLVIFGLFSAATAEPNFGVKVKCYLQDGTVVCPGCNSRAGLSCPRNLKTQSCNVPNEFPYTEQPSITQSYENETKQTTVVETQDLDPKNATHEITPFDGITQEEIEYWSKEAQENLQFRLFLYRILQSTRNRRRWRRDAQMLEEDNTCEWNGDCPCPLICCKTGDGCPKRCMKGIRLPPPWG